MSEDISKITAITEKEIKEKSMSTLPTRPNSNGLYGETKLTPQELKVRMDALPLLALEKINKIINGMGADGAVANTIKFKHGEDEYSLAELFAMMFEAENGIGDILVTSIRASDLATKTQPETDGYITLNVALENLFTFSELFKEYDEAISGYRDSITTYQKNIEVYKTNIEVYKTEINKTLEQIKTEVNNAFDELKNYADSLVAIEVTT